MKINRYLKSALAATAGLALASAACQAQTVVTYSITNTFPNGGVETPVSGGGTSVASWIFWYSLYQDYDGAGYNLPMTNAPTFNANDAQAPVEADSGSLNMFMPWASAGGHSDQSLVVGDYGNQGTFDGSIVIPVDIITQVSCDVYVAEPTSAEDSTGDFGSFGFGLSFTYHVYNTTYDYVTIPGSASMNWVHLTAGTNNANFVAHETGFINNVNENASGWALYYNTYGNGGAYPAANLQVYVDNVGVQTSSAPPPPPPPPSLNPPINFTIAGLNCIMISGAGQYNREELGAGDAGYGPADAATVTYSWTYGYLPPTPHTSYQAHFFICSDDNGTMAQNSSADYGAKNVIFTQVQRLANNSGNFYLRCKVEQPDGNGQLFAAPNPLITVNDPNPVGQWTLQFVGSVATVTSPSGNIGSYDLESYCDTTDGSTVSPATTFAAAFGDPQVIQLGSQANNPPDEGQVVVYDNFSLTGPASAFTDNFVADSVGNDLSTTPNAPWSADGDADAIEFIEGGDTNLLVSWGVNSHFDLQADDAGLFTPNYLYLTGGNVINSALPEFKYVSSNAVWVTPSTYLSAIGSSGPAWSNQLYFRLEEDN